MNYCLISKMIDKNGEFCLTWARILTYDKQTHSGVFISQNDKITQKVTKDIFDKIFIGTIKQVSYQFN